MCGMCGLWGGTDHWSNPARLPGAERGVNTTRARALQAGVVSSFTRAGGVTVRDWGQASWVVENFSGGTEIVDSLGSVWPAVEKLTGRRLDPLSPEFLQLLEARQRA